MKRVILLIFLLAQISLACQGGDSPGNTYDTWMKGKSEMIQSLQEQGITFPRSNFGLYDVVQIPELPYLLDFEVPKINIAPEEEFILTLIQYSKWKTTYEGWQGATFYVGKYKLKLPEFITPKYILDILTNRIFSNKYNMTDVGYDYPDPCSRVNDNFELQNPYNEPVLIISITFSFLATYVAPKKSKILIQNFSNFIVFENDIKNLNMYLKYQDLRLGAIFIFRL